MFSVNKKKNNKQLATGALPIAFAIISSSCQSVAFLIVGIISLFLIIGMVPLFKRRENLWMFVFVGLAGLPINLSVAYQIISVGLVEETLSISNYIWLAVLCCVFFSLEELAFGIITRFIWPKQYKIKL